MRNVKPSRPIPSPGRSRIVRLTLLLVVVAATCSVPGATVPTIASEQKELPMPGELFPVSDRIAFLIPAPHIGGPDRPWVWYAPTLPRLPGTAERWMFERFLTAGIAIAGIDVGESYGSPAGQRLYTALHTEMTTRRGYAKKPVLLGRSRGGLMTLAWATAHPQNVAGFVGIYPVCDLTSYPGLGKAAPAFELNPDELKTRLDEFNPIAGSLARARVPLFAIHGDADALVPLAQNSLRLKERYEALGGSMVLIIPPGQGHSMWAGFFQSNELVEFVITHAKPKTP